MSKVLAVFLICSAMVSAPLCAQDEQPARQLLDAVREDLVELRFEKALAGIEALLGETGMSQAERAEALILRVQAHVAFGDLEAAEDDYREILRMRPGYEPGASLTPEKAMVRYRKVRDELIGLMRIDLRPRDARLTVDGEEVVPGAEGLVPLLAGEHQVGVSRAGHDPSQETIVIVAGEERLLGIRLLPNSRTVVLRTEREGVAVLVDGMPVGETVRPGELAGPGQAAELAIENLPAGEHVYELRKECFRDERFVDVLTIDLMDSAPKTFRAISMVPASSTLILEGGLPGAEVFVDGEAIGRLPMAALTVCPGLRRVEVRHGGRPVWQASEEFEESVGERLDVAPRPNAALIGAEAWPSGLADYASQFSIDEGSPLPPDVDLSTSAGWGALRLPENSDLALGVVRATREGAQDLWYLYSPILRSVQRLDGAPERRGRPAWSALSWGVRLADSEVGGPAMVVGLLKDGPAAAAGLAVGDRIVTVAGQPVGDSAGLYRILVVESGLEGVPFQWLGADGQSREARIAGLPTPLLGSGPHTGERAISRAAWAVLDGLCRPDEAPAAMANLALLFSAHGHHDLSADTWRRVHWGERPGIGEGTKQYYFAVELELLGEEEQAVAAYRRAAASQATAFDDAGPRIGPAAEDRLADLGIALSAR
jgi:hypothetical protein